jgi:hypothetical protein
LQQDKAGGKDDSQLNPARNFQPCAQFFGLRRSGKLHRLSPPQGARILGKFIESCGLINGQRAILL